MATDIAPATAASLPARQPASFAVASAATPLASALPAPLLAFVQRMRAQPAIATATGAAVLVSFLVAAVLWGRSPDYKVLYTNISPRDGGEIIASLQQMNVPYQITEGSGVIMVPAQKVSELRLTLAKQGLPKAGGVGFELLDNQKFGASQFQEQVNYQRGLEGELVRSIESIGAVQSARVHLALPKPSLFVRDQKKPTASVMLTLNPGRALDDGQVSAIVHLVSSSVADMEDKAITVVDQRGNLLSAANTGTHGGLDTTQLKYVENIEQSYARRIEAILQPIVGAGNVRAQVAADVDFSVTEGTEEKYRPNQDPGTTAIRSQQSTESTQIGDVGAGGVPGALSNQPPANATAPLSVASGAKAGAAAAARPAKGSSRRDVTTNYEVDRTIRHTQRSAGVTRHLSAGVVVNNREARGKDGKLTSVPLTLVEMDQITNLVKEAMGYNEARGDTVKVVNSPFSVEAPPEIVPVPLWKDSQTMELVRTGGMYFLAAALGIAIVVALARRKRNPELIAVATAPLPEGEQPPQLDAPDPAMLEQAAREAQQKRINERREANIGFARQMSTNDPRLVASLVRHWMST